MKELPTAALALDATQEERSMPFSESIKSIKYILEEIKGRAESGYEFAQLMRGLSPIQTKALLELDFRLPVVDEGFTRIEWGPAV